MDALREAMYELIETRDVSEIKVVDLMMVEMMQPRPDDVICDPAAGTSGFLVAAGEWLKENRKQDIFYNAQRKDHFMNGMFHGYDMDRT